ncbi:MAG: hypothetical protein HDQ87_07655 [Clostridia bacterium]|nr:hypothetical protein [Clostridia bacterium]
MNRLRKTMATLLVALCIIGCSSVALASRVTFTSKRIYGGASQSVATLARERSINIEQRVDYVNWNGQSDWKFRGYNGGEACTELKTIPSTGVGNWLADFTKYPSAVTVRESIRSSSPSDYLIFSGILYV